MVHNFSAGPAILPQEVLKQSSEAIIDFGEGMSLLEISHRSKAFVAVMDEAEALVRDLLSVPDDYAVLFLTGGASSQFFMAAMNLLKSDATAAYLDTGTWSAKAIKEAKHFGGVEVVASSKEQGYTHVPKSYTVTPEHAYFHITTNNTVFGNQLQDIPQVDCPLVADMSSDILSRPIDVSKYDMIYAGAQKNMGPAGVTLVIVRKDALGQTGREIPTMLDYRTHIAKGSMFNTPPVFPIYVSMLNMRWVKAQGGVAAMQQRNAAKAAALYAEVDRNPCFYGTVAAEDRSHMNAVFALKDGFGTEKEFLDRCDAAAISGIKGHRSVGGFRASMYNAMDLASVQALVDVMKAYSRDFG